MRELQGSRLHQEQPPPNSPVSDISTASGSSQSRSTSTDSSGGFHHGGESSFSTDRSSFEEEEDEEEDLATGAGTSAAMSPTTMTSRDGFGTMTSGEGLISSPSESYSFATNSTSSTQPTSPGRSRFSAKQCTASPNTADAQNDHKSSGSGSGSDEESDDSPPPVPSLDQKRTSASKSSFRTSPKSFRDRLPSPKELTVETDKDPVTLKNALLRNRVPGGAAAKLMLLGPKKSDESFDDADLVQALSQETARAVDEREKELEQSLQRAKDEFDRGTEANRRYKAATSKPYDEFDEPEESSNDEMGDSKGLSFLNRNEIFHETAAAAVAALLTPRETHGSSLFSGGFGEIPTVMSSSSAFQAPKGDASVYSMSTDVQPYESLARRDVSDKLISAETEKKLQEMPEKMKQPNKTLRCLLEAIALSDDQDRMDLACMIRRKNACGALQVLTANAKDRVKICWTVGVLPALTSVLADTGDETLEMAFPERRLRFEFIEARKRAISTLMNLAVPKENRVPICHTPDLIPWLIAIIKEDTGSARQGCCAILAYLAKSSDNRLLMVQVPGLMEALVEVLKPCPPQVESPTSTMSEGKKDYPWSSNDESDSSAFSDTEDDEVEPNDTIISNATSNQSDHENSEGDPSESIEVTKVPSPAETADYDDDADDMLCIARQNVFALLSHLGKEKDNAYHFARDSSLIATMVTISGFEDSPSRSCAVKILANLTRHRLNTKMLVFKHRPVVPALVQASQANQVDVRLYACYALQNLAQDKSCRQELAITDNLITALCSRTREGGNNNERLAAVSALKNLCDEPANLIPVTNTPDCVSTLMHLAHGDTEDEVSEIIQYKACDGLATLSHWMRKIATSGVSLDAIQKGQPPTNQLAVPSLRVITWNQWQ